MFRVCTRCAKDMDAQKAQRQQEHQMETERAKSVITHETFVSRGRTWKAQHNQELKRRQKENTKTCTQCSNKFVAKHCLSIDVCDSCMRSQVIAAKQRFSDLLQQRMQSIVRWCRLTRMPFWLTMFAMELSYLFDWTWLNMGFGPISQVTMGEIHSGLALFSNGGSFVWHLFSFALLTAC